MRSPKDPTAGTMSGHRRDNGGRSNTRLFAYLAIIALTFSFATGLVTGWVAHSQKEVEEPRQRDERLVGVWRPEPDVARRYRLVLLRDGSGAIFDQRVQATSITWWTSGGVLHATYDVDEEGQLGYARISYEYSSSQSRLKLSSDDLLLGGRNLRRATIS
jgi:hypothetical protein